jgi:type I restriction enzyme S subunit
MELIKLKYLVDIPVKTGASQEALDYDPQKIRYIRISDFDKTGNLKDELKASIEISDGEKFKLKNDDILIAVTGGTVGKSMMFNCPNNEPSCYAGYLARVRPELSKLDPKYLYFYLNSPFFDRFKAENMTKSTMENISASKYANMLIPWIELKAQRALVAYLESKTNEINRLIDLQDRQILTLLSFKFSKMFQKICYGIDDANESKKTNISYIPEVNKNFAISHISDLFTIIKDIIGKETQDVLSITQNGIIKKDLLSNNGQLAKSYSKYQIVREGDFAMNHMDLLTGWIDISRYDGVTSPDYRVFRIKDKNQCSKYYLYLFQCYYKFKVFYGFGQGVSHFGRWRLPASNFYSVSVPSPDYQTQSEIVEYIDGLSSNVDKIVEIKKEKIERLEEYKQSIIFDAFNRAIKEN